MAKDDAPGPGTDGDDELDGLASVVLIDRRDDLAAVCGRLDAAPTFAVVVHAPRGNTQLATELGMRRLVRHAEDMGKLVAIATGNGALAGRARRARVPVARKPDHVRWDTGGRHVLRLGRATLALPRIGGLFTPVTITVLIAAVIAALGLTMGPSATITISPPAEALSQVVTVQASPEQTSLDTADLKLPASEVTVTKQITLAVRTSGKLAVADAKAKVVLTLANTSSAEFVIPAGTVFMGAAEGSAQFALDARVVIPAGQAVTTGATAVTAGTAGNVAPASVTKAQDPAFVTGLKVTNPAAAAGGTTVDRAIVDQQDIDALTALAKDLTGSDAIKAAVVSERPDDVVFLTTATATATPGPVIPTLGSYADIAIMQVDVTITATAVLKDTIQAFGTELLRAARPGATLVPNSITAIPTGPATVAKDSDAVTTELKVTGQFATTVSEDDVRDAVKGTSTGDAESILRERYGIADPTVELTPGWAPWLPRFGFRIDVKLEPVVQSGAPASTAATNDRPATTAATPSPTPRP